MHGRVAVEQNLHGNGANGTKQMGSAPHQVSRHLLVKANSWMSAPLFIRNYPAFMPERVGLTPSTIANGASRHWMRP